MMAETEAGQRRAVANESLVAGVSWAAVAAGAVAACALTMLLLAFGAGLGLSVVSPWAGSGVSAATFKIGTGLYLIVVAMLASSIGGYLAGRLRTGWVGVHSDEVYFRDTAHGFLAWAFASVLGAALLASPASNVMGGGLSAAAQGASSAAAQSSGPMDQYVDTLFRSSTPTAPTQGDPAASRSEMVRLFTTGFRSGSELKPADRAYVTKVVAARTGLSEVDAEKRVNEVMTEVKADLDATRKATAKVAFWLAASLLIGAFCASLAATEGGGLRDGTWGSRARR
jgi:hypothetical protein